MILWGDVKSAFYSRCYSCERMKASAAPASKYITFHHSHLSAQSKLCSLNPRCFLSFSLVLYSQSSFGHSTAKSGSFHGIPPSDAGSYTSVHLKVKVAESERTKKPCANPAGIQNICFLSESSSTPTYFPCVCSFWKKWLRSTPLELQLSLSCTDKVGMPTASKSRALKVSVKYPLLSPNTCGEITNSPFIACSSNLNITFYP